MIQESVTGSRTVTMVRVKQVLTYKRMARRAVLGWKEEQTLNAGTSGPEMTSKRGKGTLPRKTVTGWCGKWVTAFGRHVRHFNAFGRHVNHLKALEGVSKCLQHPKGVVNGSKIVDSIGKVLEPVDSMGNRTIEKHGRHHRTVWKCWKRSRTS